MMITNSIIHTWCHLVNIVNIVNTCKVVDIIVNYDAKKIILLLLNKSAERRSRRILCSSQCGATFKRTVVERVTDVTCIDEEKIE